jgi:hypothetical protein
MRISSWIKWDVEVLRTNDSAVSAAERNSDPVA